MKKHEKYNRLKNTVESRKGKLLSEEYINCSFKYTFECERNHIWKASDSSIRLSNSWCPECNIGFSERACRIAMNTIFGRKFIKIRPDWLLNPTTGFNLELDGFNEELKLAFEHNGLQHYKKRGSDSKNQLKSRIDKDRLKIEICEKLGIKLIVIPPLITVLKLKDLKTYILDFVKNKNIPIIFEGEIDYSEAYLSDKTEYIDELKEIAKYKNGELLSKIYKGSFEKLDWKCNLHNKIWKMAPNKAKLGQWCPICSNRQKREKNYLQLLAEKNNGICFSVYNGTDTKVKWKCQDVSHAIWEARPSNISSGSWCPECSTKYRSLSFYSQIAESKGGKCLSTVYLGSNIKLEWKCQNKEHSSWFATPSNIKQGSWCIECHRQKNEDTFKLKAKEIANLNKGFCLSSSFKDNRTIFEWKCHIEDHPSWSARLTTVQQGNWCRKCAIIAGKYKTTTSDKLIQLAHLKGGTVDVSNYTGTLFKYTWTCALGHSWDASIFTVQGHWCPECAGNKHKDISWLHSLAEKNNGKCLAKTYINSHTKVSWKCAVECHPIWDASPNPINRGSWCNLCAIERRKGTRK